MGIVTDGIPQNLSLILSKINGCDVFIETGTNLGNTALWASNNFKAVYTIEKSEVVYNMYKNKLSNRVHNILGDSPEELPKILNQIGQQKALIWLDAHWCGGDSAGVDNQCPLMHELVCLSERENDIILIDDARLFLCVPPLPNNPRFWPTFYDITKMLLQFKYPKYIQIINDVIIIIPDDPAIKEALIKISQECSTAFWNRFGEVAKYGQ